MRVARKLAELPKIDEELRRGAMSYSQARAISRVATAAKEAVWIACAKRMPASQLDTLCRSYQNVQAYDQTHGAMAGAVLAAHVAAQRTVTRRTLDNGMVNFEVVLASDEAAIVWAALNATLAKVRSEPSLAKQTPAEQRTAEQTPAEPSRAEPSTLESTAATTSAEQATAKIPTSADRGRQRADVFMDIIQGRVRGNRPQRTPIELIITVPHAGLHGSAEPSELAMMAVLRRQQHNAGAATLAS